jgi:hypothetical protein
MIVANVEKILITCRDSAAVMSIARMLWSVIVRGGEPLIMWIGRATTTSILALGSWIARRLMAIAAGLSSSRSATSSPRIDEGKRLQLVITIDIRTPTASETRVVIRFQVRQSSEPDMSGRSFS